MQFGLCVATHIDNIGLIEHAERLGFDRVWVPDSQMIWSDCYATLARAAERTSRIQLGTGVAIVGTRIAPVTAHSVATINRIAPGRTFLGIGSGHTAMRVMGFDPIKAPAFREYVRVVRELLAGEEVEYTLNGETRRIRFLHRDLGFIDIDDPIPIYVAANGPLALRVAGAYGDGRVAGLETPGAFRRSVDRIDQGAAAVGRTLDRDAFHTAALTGVCVLKPGERLDSDRVVDRCGSMVANALHGLWEIVRLRGTEEIVPEALRPTWEAYRDFVAAKNLPRESAGQVVHRGHCTYLLEDERQFVTPEAIRATVLVGEPDEIIEILRERERAGLNEVLLLPPMEFAEEMLTDFAEQVMARY